MVASVWVALALVLPCQSERLTLRVEEGAGQRRARCDAGANGGRCPERCVCVRLLHFNDVYKFIETKPSNVGTIDNERLVLPGGETLGGFAVLKTALDQEREKARKDGFVPIVSFGGDHLGPSFLSMFETGGLHMIEALNMLQVDMVNWGNHEFDGGAELGLWNMLCSRFPWLTANVRETVKGATGAPPLIGSRFKREARDWNTTDDGSVLGQYESFEYQPADGVFVVPLGGATNVCFAGLTTRDSASKKYGYSVRKKFPKNARKPRFSETVWGPTHQPAGGCKAPNKCSVEELFGACPARGHVRPGDAGYEFEGVQQDGEYTFLEPWEQALPGVLESARRRKCATLVMLTHLAHREDLEVLQKDPLINVVVGGHDHEPHIHVVHHEGHVEQSQKVAVKVGLDGQYIAKVDLFFSEGESGSAQAGEFDHVGFDMRDAVSKQLCVAGGGSCAPASIVAVDKHVYPENVPMLHLMQAFDELAVEYSKVHLASAFVGTFNTISVRSRETAAVNFYMDTLASWAAKELQSCGTSGQAECQLKIEPRDAELPVVGLVHGGTFRSNEYFEGRYPGNRPFSMLEVRSDLPFPDTTAIWKMSAQDLLLAMHILVSDHGDGYFPQVAGLEYTMLPKRRSAQLRSIRGARARDVLQVRLPGPGEHDSQDFEDCNSKTSSGNCLHWGNWLQDEMARDSEVLVIGPEFIMAEVMTLLEGLYSMLERISPELKHIGLDGAQLLDLVRSGRKEGHLVNLLEKQVIMYDVVKDQVRSSHGVDAPIQAGPDCVDPSLDRVVEEWTRTEYGTVEHEWAAAAAKLKRDNPDLKLCFRVKQVSEGPPRTYVTDADQQSRHQMERNHPEAVKRRFREAFMDYFARGEGLVPRRRHAAHDEAALEGQLRGLGVDAARLRDTLAEVRQFVGYESKYEGWSHVEKSWLLAKRDQRAALLGGSDLHDLFLAIGPGQWKGDDVPTPYGAFENREAAEFARNLWASGFPGRRQVVKK